MASVCSDRSKVSIKSQMLLEDVARKSTSKIYRIQGDFDDENVRLSWNAFGLYCSRQLRMGRGVLIPKFGLFTFTAPEFKLDGVTNPQIRDQQPRIPVFIISKEFASTRNIQSGICGVDGTVRPYKASGTNGAISQTKVNFTEIGIYSDMGKDNTKLCVDRVIKQLSEQASRGQNIEMEIPNVGIFYIRTKVAGVKFNDYLISDTRCVSRKTIIEKKLKGEMTLTKDNISKYLQIQDNLYPDKHDDFLDIDDKTITCLQRDFGVTMNQRALSATNLYARKQYNKVSNINFSRPVRVLNSVPFKLLTQWIRQNSFNSQDAYGILLNAGQAKDSLTNEQLATGMKKLNLTVSSSQCTELFRLLDYNKDGYISWSDWCKVVVEDGNPHLARIRQQIKTQNMSKHDIFGRMKLDKEHPNLGILEVKEAIKAFDPALGDVIALSVARYLLRDDETITLPQFAQFLDLEDDDDNIEDSSQTFEKGIVGRIKHFLNCHTNPRCLEEQFLQLDIKNEGVLSATAFKSAFLKLDVGLTINEIGRLTRQCPKDKNGLLVYTDLLKLLHVAQQGESHTFEDLEDFVHQLREFMRLNSIMKANDLLQKVQKVSKQFEEIKLSTFTSFLQKMAFPYSSEGEILPYTNIIDIDNDGIINALDVQTFLDCNGYMMQHAKHVNHGLDGLSLTASAFQHKKQLNSPLREQLYPTKHLMQGELELVMRELRQKLYLKKISNYELFKLLDQNQDGFVTIQEFQVALGKWGGFTRETLDGLFACMDRHKIGMIDYQSLLDHMNSAIDKKDETASVKPDDNWEWPNQTLERIRRWSKGERLRPEDAFRVLDRDFDGAINKHDLEGFLREVLKCTDKEITQSRINRLFKLLDFFKRGQLQLIDIIRLLSNEDVAVIQDQTITGGRAIIGKSFFDWKLNAKQQIGIVISRIYKSIREKITTNNVRMTYKVFSSWVEQKKVLIGFDLTDQLLQQVFSELDPHKKGYVTQDDWINAFTGYAWQEQMFKEVQQQLQVTFPDLRSAYTHFTGSISSKLNVDQFEQHMNSLFPERFSYSDILSLWKKMTDNAQSIDFNRFSIIFEPRKKSNIRPKTAGMVQPLMHESHVSNDHSDQIMHKLRSLIKSSNVNMKDVFMKFDTQGCGSISNLEFKNALRALNLGLTSKEIDQLLNCIDESGDGMINWMEFCRKLQPTTTTVLINQRCKSRLQILSHHLHHYLLSPKDAFRTFDTNRVGHITFAQFCKLINKVCQMANEALPPFSIMRDMFEVIDIRCDGVVDEREWVQTFGQFDPPETIMKEQGEQELKHKSRSRSRSPRRHEVKLSGSRAAAHFESASKDFDKIMKILGRNRKYLVDVFSKMSKIKPLTYDMAQEILEQLFSSLGFNIDVSCYPLLLRFAEKDGIIDYKFMLEVYKERSGRIDGHPNPE